MKRIKFRVWNKELKTYFYSDHTIGINNENSEIWGEVELCTGLKDEHDKEVFEGDIVLAYEENIDDTEGRNVVIYDNGCFRFRRAEVIDIPCGTYRSYNIEIIGNIHENPELLT